MLNCSFIDGSFSMQILSFLLTLQSNITNRGPNQFNICKTHKLKLHKSFLEFRNICTTVTPVTA